MTIDTDICIAKTNEPPLLSAVTTDPRTLQSHHNALARFHPIVKSQNTLVPHDTASAHGDTGYVQPEPPRAQAETRLLDEVADSDGQEDHEAKKEEGQDDYEPLIEWMMMVEVQEMIH